VEQKRPEDPIYGMLLLALLMQGGAIQGLCVEDRSNHVHGCCCEWSGESQTGGREAILA
jgi:hypothetical protein